MTEARIHRSTTSKSDVAVQTASWLALVALLVPLGLIVGDLLMRGATSLSPQFLVDSPSKAGREGGIGPVLLSTLLVMGVCLLVVVPLGLAAAIGLNEYLRRGGFAVRTVRIALDVLAGTPSIALGMFGYAFFCIALGMGVSILAGGLTLACMVMPLYVRLSEQALRTVPDDVRAAADALALRRYTAILRIVLPVAAPGLFAATGLALARALAETAALLFTSGYVSRTPGSLLDPGRVLAVHIFDLSMNVPGGDGPAYATALVLVALLLSVSGVPRLVRGFTRRWSHPV
ncbi:MAG: phosphate ABC transporter permease PstA [Phycisphaerae bacterium]|nr:phosphate ABC transporter permease PstA [Phycisphaerae bacterium]